MNKRLKELAEQAAEYCKTQPREIAGTMWEEKFAELIIEKCGDIADNSVDHGIPSAYIDEYFGV
jgi:hypothetical protein